MNRVLVGLLGRRRNLVDPVGVEVEDLIGENFSDRDPLSLVNN